MNWSANGAARHATSTAKRSVSEGRVLIVDPSSSESALCRSFALLGYEPSVCGDAHEALAACARERPALLVLELRLRKGTGLELLDRLRDAPTAPPRVVVTAYASVATAVRAIQLGAAAYLSKPTTAALVLEALDSTPAAPRETELRPMSLDRAIWEYINAIHVQAGTIAEAARRLRLDRRSLRRMLAKYAPV